PIVRVKETAAEVKRVEAFVAAARFPVPTGEPPTLTVKPVGLVNATVAVVVEAIDAGSRTKFETEEPEGFVLVAAGSVPVPSEPSTAAVTASTRFTLNTVEDVNSTTRFSRAPVAPRNALLIEPLPVVL